MVGFHHALLLLLLAGSTQARNIVITADGIAVATTAPRSQNLIAYDANTQQETLYSFDATLPSIVGGFDAVAVDPNAVAGDSAVAFALDAGSGIVCSFDLTNEDAQGVALSLVGCTTQQVSSSPFVGISAMGGTLVVSGGTGGASVFTYDEDTGVLSNSATIRNQQLGDIGYPDVTLVATDTAAFSTDANGESVRFGVVVSSINLDSQSLSRDRFFGAHDSLQFTFALPPASFPLTSSVYFDTDSGKNYLYVANGGVTVQDPLMDGEPTVVTSLPGRFDALTVDVNSERARAVFGGTLAKSRGRSASIYVVLDISDPLNPTFVNRVTVTQERSGSERITGVASAGDDILYVMNNSANIGHGSLQALKDDVAASTA